MRAIDVDGLLKAVSAEAPCGYNLEYDLLFVEMEAAAQGKPEQQYGSTLIPAEEPNWPEVQDKALELLTRTRDLRVAVHLARALLHTRGLSGFSDGLALLRGLLERYWETVHPQLDPDDAYDPTLRLNLIASLADPETTLRGLREVPLVSSPTLGQLTLRDIEIALGKLAPPATAEDTLLPELSVIDGAFMICPVETLQATIQAVSRTLEQVQRIEALLTERAGAIPDLSALTDLLEELQQFVSERLARRRMAMTAMTQEAPAEKPAPPVEAGRPAVEAIPGASVAAPAAVGGEITSREDIIRLLDQMCDYFDRHEPSSPVPLLLNRARRLMAMNFLDILRDLAPAGLAQAELIGGTDSDRPER